MSAEQIVRRLAADGPLVNARDGSWCASCGLDLTSGCSRSGASIEHGHWCAAITSEPSVANGTIIAGKRLEFGPYACGMDPENHAPDCLCRLACEWVAANPPGRATIPEQIEADRLRREAHDGGASE